jgi:hypothetical protein
MEEKINVRGNSPFVEDDIDLLEILKTFWQKRSAIFLSAGIFLFLGVIISSLQSPAQFKSETSFLLKSGGGGSGGGTESLGGLAAIAGISLPSGGLSSGSDISPSLYPKFISSIEFQKALIKAPITIEGGAETVTYEYYYENMVKPSRLELVKSYTIGLPATIKSMINPSGPIIKSEKESNNLLKLSPNESAHFARLENQLKIESKDGVMVLSFSMPEPLAAAQMADFAFNLLQKEIIDYKLGNLREELRFSESIYEEKRKEFEKIQNELGYYKDRNQNHLHHKEEASVCRFVGVEIYLLD